MTRPDSDGDVMRYTVTVETLGSVGIGDVLRAITDIDGELSLKDVRSHQDKTVEIPIADLTEIQRETLIRAVAVGYYSFPREVSLDVLCEEFDISKSAVSQRLRKAEATIVQRVVAEIAPEAGVDDGKASHTVDRPDGAFENTSGGEDSE